MATDDKQTQTHFAPAGTLFRAFVHCALIHHAHFRSPLSILLLSPPKQTKRRRICVHYSHYSLFDTVLIWSFETFVGIGSAKGNETRNASMAANPTKRAVDDTNPAVATSVHDSAAGIDSTEPEQVPVNDSEVLVKHVAEVRLLEIVGGRFFSIFVVGAGLSPINDSLDEWKLLTSQIHDHLVLLLQPFSLSLLLNHFSLQETSILSETNKNSVDTHQDESFQARGSSQQGPLESGSTAKAAESITPEPSSSKKNLDERNVVSESDKEAAMMEEESPTSTELAADKNTANQSCESSSENHSPTVLPRFKEPSTCMWTATYAANAPSEDRSSSLVNVLLKPWNTTDTASLVRLSLWSVIDGHGGGCVATYASEVLLPHIAANISKSLECDIVDGGECRVNGQLRDANAIDFEGLLESPTGGQSNPNSIHYRTPLEDDYNDSEHDVESISMDVGVGEEACDDDQSVESRHSCSPPFPFYSPSSPSSSTDESVASVESRRLASGPVGTHSTDEVARVTDAVTDSFCAVDEGWINSIDSVASRQTCCETNGAWNAGACALVVFTIQRLEWTSDVGTNKQDSSESRDDLDSERTNEKEDTEMSNTAHICNPEDSRIRIPGGCECHFYQLQDAMLYTGHVGDCRAVLLGDAPLPDNDIDEVVDSAEESDSDESSYHSYDVTEVLSTSDADDDSSDDEQEDGFGFLENSEIPARMRFMTRPARRLRSATRNSYHHEPFVPLPPLSNHQKEVSSESEDDLQPARKVPRKNHESFSQGNGHVEKPVSPALHLSPLPSTLIAFDLTTDHTPYNETEADAVLRRSNNAPKAISCT